jgi:hypothetical protein
VALTVWFYAEGFVVRILKPSMEDGKAVTNVLLVVYVMPAPFRCVALKVILHAVPQDCVVQTILKHRV